MPSMKEPDDQINRETEDSEVSESQMDEKVEPLSGNKPNIEAAPGGLSGQMLEEARKVDDISQVGPWRGFGRGRCQGYGRVGGNHGRGGGMRSRHRACTRLDMPADLKVTMPEFTKQQRIVFLNERVGFLEKAIKEFVSQIEAMKGSASNE